MEILPQKKKVAGSKTGLERYGSTIKFANLCWHHAQQGLCNQFASHPLPTFFPPFSLLLTMLPAHGIANAKSMAI